MDGERDADDPEGPGASTALTFLNGRINSVAGGTDQMQRNAIGEQVLGLPPGRRYLLVSSGAEQEPDR